MLGEQKAGKSDPAQPIGLGQARLEPDSSQRLKYAKIEISRVRSRPRSGKKLVQRTQPSVNLLILLN